MTLETVTTEPQHAVGIDQGAAISVAGLVKRYGDLEAVRGVSFSIPPAQIEAIEVYTSAAQIPAQFNKTSNGCGVMVIWTRI